MLTLLVVMLAAALAPALFERRGAAAQRVPLLQADPARALGAILGLAFTGLVIHAIFLACHYLVATHALKLRLDLKESVVVMCSQKTLPMVRRVLRQLTDADVAGAL